MCVDYNNWFNNTVLTKQVHTDDVMVATFQHPGTILFRMTFTLLANPKSIQITGDINPAVFRPTWNPLKQYDYGDSSTGYILGKLECCGDDDDIYTADTIQQDWESLIDEYQEDQEQLKIIRRIIDDVIYPNMDSKLFRERALMDLMDEDDVMNEFEDEDIWDFRKIGARANNSKLLYVAGLRTLSRVGAFDKSVNRIVIGNPDDFRR